MNRIVRLWNQHRKGFILIIGAFVFLIIVIQILNQMAKDTRLEKESINANVSLYEQAIEEQDLPIKASVDDAKTDVETAKENVIEIDEFVEKCNNGEISEAYNMLTDYCKEELFPTEELFKKGYYNTRFDKKRMTDIKSYKNEDNRYTYLVKFYEDLLSTGQRIGSNFYQEYITVDKNSTNGKLNIKNLVYKKSINKEKENEGIIVTVLSQSIYQDREKYEVKIENTTDKAILMNTKEKGDAIYLVGKNGELYTSDIFETADSLYAIYPHMYRKYDLSFEKKYGSTIEAKGIAFTDIVSDSEIYEQNQENMKERLTIGILF